MTEFPTNSGAVAPEAIDILIVEDNAPLRTVYCAMLAHGGLAHVRVAASGLEALELLRGRPADVLLVDYAMPTMSGLDFLRALKADPKISTPQRVIMISGYDDRAAALQAREAGADLFIAKPISPRALLNAVSP